MARATFACTEDSLVGIVGAESGVQIDGFKLSSNRSFFARQGQKVTLEPPRNGARLYVATNDEFPISPRALDLPPSILQRQIIAITPHRPELMPADWLALPLVVSGSMDRMGIRLPWFSGYHAKAEEASRPVDVGQIQLTPDGTAIILGPDGPTIGGYPIVASVHPAHLGRVAQWTPGLKIQFCQSTASTLDDYLRRLKMGLAPTV
jgi:allophanate hydrolase subunit 2